jgi:Nuclease-related domain
MFRQSGAQSAGVYARQRYERGLRNWRRRMRWILAACFGPFVIAGFVVLALDRQLLPWCAGLLSGAAVAAWLALRESPPAYVENWRNGEAGERKTAKALKPLERSGLNVVHDVQVRFGNYDHIAVGRSGVYLLETKNPSGIVEYRDGQFWLQRRLDPDASARLDEIRSRALASAAAVKEEIERRTGIRSWVQAVVVFWSDFPDGLVEDGRCVFVHGSGLRAWLESRPDCLDERKVETFVTAIGALADDAA